MSFLTAGALLVVFAGGVHLALRLSRAGALGPAFVALFGFGLLGAGAVGPLLVRLSEKEGVMRKQLAGIGHATTVESGSMDTFLAWRVVEAREIHFLQHERRMVRAIRSRRGWAPGVAAEDADFAGTAQPTLLVYGTNDPLGSVDLWRRKVDLMPRGELEVVENGGHLLWYHDPTGVGTRVQRFLGA